MKKQQGIIWRICQKQITQEKWILLVEDNELNREIAVEILQMTGDRS